MKIIYEDNHLLVTEKPPNMPVQKDSSHDPDLLSELKAYVKQKYENQATFTWDWCIGWTGL